jgi:hypothetical protein
MADLKALAEQIVNLTLLQAQELKQILKDDYGIEPAAGGAVMMAWPGRWPGRSRRGKDRIRRHPRRCRCQQDQRDQGSPRDHRSGPERGQGPGGSRRQGREGASSEGRSRRTEEEARSGWCQGRAEVIHGVPHPDTKRLGPARPGPAKTVSGRRSACAAPEAVWARERPVGRLAGMGPRFAFALRRAVRGPTAGAPAKPKER